jgi:hypothetical protein
MSEWSKRIRQVGSDLFVVPGSVRSVLVYREGMLPLRIKLTEVEPLIEALRSVSDELAARPGPKD